MTCTVLRIGGNGGGRQCGIAAMLGGAGSAADEATGPSRQNGRAVRQKTVPATETITHNGKQLTVMKVSHARG